jgi:hypothetical protein
VRGQEGSGWTTEPFLDGDLVHELLHLKSFIEKRIPTKIFVNSFSTSHLIDDNLHDELWDQLQHAILIFPEMRRLNLDPTETPKRQFDSIRTGGRLRFAPELFADPFHRRLFFVCATIADMSESDFEWLQSNYETGKWGSDLPHARRCLDRISAAKFESTDSLLRLYSECGNDLRTDGLTSRLHRLVEQPNGAIAAIMDVGRPDQMEQLSKAKLEPNFDMR